MGARKTEKKIRNYRKFAIECLADAVKYDVERQHENDEKKLRKLEKKVEGKRHMAAVYIRDLNKMGYDFSGFMESLEPEQARVLKELFPYGLGKEIVEKHRRRNLIINMFKGKIKKLKEAEVKYEPYDPTLPVKEKLKNRIYKAEVNIGWYMVLESKKTESTYEPAWNYEEHFATTVEFTEEEREIIERCYEVGKEYDAYNDERFAFLETIGNGLQTFARSYEETSDRIQAEKWAEKLYTEIFPKVIDIAAPGRKFSSKELETISRGLTKKMLEFVADDSRLESALATWESLSGEADVKLQQLNDAACAQFRGIGGARERMLRAGVDRITVADIDSRRVMMIELMKERAGADEAYFTFLYTELPDQERFRRIMTKYSPEELGV